MSGNFSYTFVSQGLDEKTFKVLRFQGEERISACYRYEIELASDKADIDFDKILKNPATLTIKNSSGALTPVSGILARFEQTRRVGKTFLYAAILVPRLFRLSLIHQNQVFLGKTMKEIVTQLLKDGGLDSNAFTIKLNSPGEKLDYVCQFRETHLAFMEQRMEQLGWYYFFEQEKSGEKLVITDTKDSHKAFRSKSTLGFNEPAGLEPKAIDDGIYAFICRQQLIPGKITTKNYNYKKPSLDVKGSSVISSSNKQEMYFYGGHYDMPEEASAAAKNIADEFKCRERLFHADTTAAGVAPGKLFTMSGHYRKDFNREYLVIENLHEGNQTGLFPDSFGGQRTGEEPKRPWYRNTVTAIESDRQFRPERKTEPARFYGTLNAKIDASGNGDYAELDKDGCYKVILPFDLSSPEAGKASCPLRMMQPYGGKSEGIHFPLRKGAEVLLTFIDGDPDRPVIAGALPNVVNPSPVNDKNVSMCKILSPSGGVIHFEEQEKKESILISSKTSASWIRLGEGLDNKKTGLTDKEPQKGIRVCTDNHLVIDAADDSTTTFGKKYTFTVAGDYIATYKANFEETFKKDRKRTTEGKDEETFGDAKTTTYKAKYEGTWKDKASCKFQGATEYSYCDKVNETFNAEKKETFQAKRTTMLNGGSSETASGKVEKTGTDIKQTYTSGDFTCNNLKQTIMKASNTIATCDNTIQKESNTCQMSTNTYMTLQNTAQQFTLTAAQISIV